MYDSPSLSSRRSRTWPQGQSVASFFRDDGCQWTKDSPPLYLIRKSEPDHLHAQLCEMPGVQSRQRQSVDRFRRGYKSVSKRRPRPTFLPRLVRRPASSATLSSTRRIRPAKPRLRSLVSQRPNWSRLRRPVASLRRRTESPQAILRSNQGPADGRISATPSPRSSGASLVR